MARLVIFFLLLLGTAMAQNLLPLAPQGAIAGFYVNDLGKSPYLKGVFEDWKESGMEALLLRELRREAGAEADLLGIASGGVAVAVYNQGFFLVARPSQAAMQAIRRDSKDFKPQGGWMVGTDGEVTTGYSRDLVFVATPTHARLFLQGRRGLQAPVKGDIALWASPPQNLLQELGLPPRTSGAARTIQRFSYSLTLTAGGYTDETRLDINPQPDPAFASFFLPKERPFDAADLPQGYGVSTGVLDLGRFATYLGGLTREWDLPLNYDLRAFGSRYATVTVKGPPPAPDGRSESLLGHSLIYWEVRDPATAEANLLALLQNLAAFSTPEGTGGFKVLPNEGDFKAVELGLSGNLYYKLEAGRMVIATSKSALEATKNRPWRDSPDYQKFRARIPANAVGYTFGDQGGPLLESVNQLRDTLPQTIGNELGQRTSRELADKLTDFLTRLGKRFGSGLSYAVVQGNSLVSKGFYEIRWR